MCFLFVFWGLPRAPPGGGELPAKGYILVGTQLFESRMCCVMFIVFSRGASDAVAQLLVAGVAAASLRAFLYFVNSKDSGRRSFHLLFQFLAKLSCLSLAWPRRACGPPRGATGRVYYAVLVCNTI